MSRTILLAAIAVLGTVAPGYSQTEDDSDDSESNIVHLRDGMVSFGHDPHCAGCRAFLTGYGTAESMSSPSCSCGAGTGDGGTMDMGGTGGPVANDYQELLASDFGAGLGYESAAPGMVGDFFGGGYQLRADEFRTFQPDYFNTSVAGADRRYKIAENNSPFPVDRAFFNFNHFHNALRTADGREANLDRGVLGLEKTFLDQWWSCEFRLPFVSGLNGDQILNSPVANNVSGEMGNFGLAMKRLLYRDATLAASVGLGVVLPTGSDARVFSFPGDPLPDIEIDNEAYYLQPFAGVWWMPSDQSFCQLAVQADFDARGNPVIVDQTLVGTIQDQTLLFLDASYGYWLMHDPYGEGIVTGIAPMIELHYTSTLQDTDVVDFGRFVGGGSTDTNSVTNPNNRQNILNMTGALRLELAGTSFLTFAGVVPLRSDEKLFDAEFSAQFVQYY